MKRALFLVAAMAVAPGIVLHAQSQRADTASRTSASQAMIQSATQTQSATGVSTSETEADLGDQQPVGAASGGIGFYAIGSAGLYYTSNPALSKDGGRGDLFFSAQGGAGIHPNLIGGLYLDGHVSEEVYEYAHFSNLDFNRFNAGGGLDYVFESLGQLTASVHYEYERYLDGRNLKEFYVNNALTTALTKQFVINDANAIELGWQGSFSLTAIPASARRDAYDFWVGHRWQIARPLELQTYYIVTIYHYTDDIRTDLSQNVGGSLSLNFTRWARISASASFGANNSTNSFFDYTVVNVGGAVSLDLRF